MGIQRFKKHLSDSVVNADNASLSSMDTTSFLSVFDDADVDKGGKKSGGGAKTIAKELEKVCEVHQITQYYASNHSVARRLLLLLNCIVYAQRCHLHIAVLTDIR